MKQLIIFLCFVIPFCVCPPVKPPKPEPESDTYDKVEYSRYLQEVIKELEKDEGFQNRMKSMNASETENSELLAQHLDFVHHNVRSRLDEIKRREVERLNILEAELRRLERKKSGEKDVPRGRGLSSDDVVKLEQFTKKHHLDHENPHTFEVEDLKKLISATMSDLDIVDKKEDEEFKKYEMSKEHKKRAELRKIKDEAKRKEKEREYAEREQRHKKHEKINHPGSEEQLKEVWEKEDHLDRGEFNPRTFFNLHDTNGDNFLDISELESLMNTELGKAYDSNNTDDDMNERYHEMVRMRKEVEKEMDQNKDNLISMDEFIHWTKSRDYKKDEEWKNEDEDDKEVFNDDDFKQYEDEYAKNHPGEDDDYLTYVQQQEKAKEGGAEHQPQHPTEPEHKAPVAVDAKHQAPPTPVQPPK